MASIVKNAEAAPCDSSSGFRILAPNRSDHRIARGAILRVHPAILAISVAGAPAQLPVLTGLGMALTTTLEDRPFILARMVILARLVHLKS